MSLVEEEIGLCIIPGPVCWRHGTLTPQTSHHAETNLHEPKSGLGANLKICAS